MDEIYMQMALMEAVKGRYTAPPNPWVGCVIVIGNEVIGRGYHLRPGTPHAEVVAVNDALSRNYSLDQATVYVTLEPCHHYGRTPPCDLLLLKHRVKRVVVALLDPDTKVAGQGVALLQQHGIEVEVGVCKFKAEACLRPYLHHRLTGKPWVVAKIALSLDGKIACSDYTSKWITGSEARQDAHHLRALSQAILVGSGTALKDDPLLTVRDFPPLERGAEGAEGAHAPLRVVLDTKGQVTKGNLMLTQTAPTLIYYHQVDSNTKELWDAQSVESYALPLNNNKLDLEFALRDLGRRGVLQLLVEGGATVQGELLALDLVDELTIYYGSIVIGNGIPWLGLGLPLSNTISEAKHWRLQSVEQLGQDAKLVLLR